MPTMMKRLTYEDYLEYARSHDSIVVDGSRIRLEPVRVERLAPREGEVTDTSTTVWSFPRRGTWATHRGDYRGNWPPQMARVLIQRYTSPGETVLDPMVGSGTTCIEARLLARNCIGVDVSLDALMLALHRLYWLDRALQGMLESGVEVVEHEYGETRIRDMLEARVEVYHGDARSLTTLGDGSVDLVATHPPYYRIIRYSRGERSPGDLSTARSLEAYLDMLEEAAREAYRVLRPGRHMAVLLGDTRMRRHYVPLTSYALARLLRAGFLLREEVVKLQHNMKTTREKWSRLKERDFLLIYHEKLYILRKPSSEKDRKRYRYSGGLF